MVRRYQQVHRLGNVQDDTITQVAFSPSGTFIATASLDGKVCLWRLHGGQLLYVWFGDSAILSLIWLPGRDDAMLCGTQNGNLAVLTVTSSSLSVSGFWAHKYPIECLSIHNGWLATGAHRELTVWKQNDDHIGQFRRIIILPEPSGEMCHSGGNNSEVLITSIHWTSAESASLLLSTYMYHGVQIFETSTWTRLRSIPLHGPIAHAALSSDGLFLAISNLQTGIDVYDMNTEQLVASFDHEVGNAWPVQVVFMHDDRALSGGSMVGEVDIYDMYEGRLHSLSVPRGSQVRAMAAHFIAGEHVGQHRYFIATGVTDGTGSYCIVWEANDLTVPNSSIQQSSMPAINASETELFSPSQTNVIKKSATLSRMLYWAVGLALGAIVIYTSV